MTNNIKRKIVYDNSAQYNNKIKNDIGEFVNAAKFRTGYNIIKCSVKKNAQKLTTQMSLSDQHN